MATLKKTTVFNFLTLLPFLHFPSTTASYAVLHQPFSPLNPVSPPAQPPPSSINHQHNRHHRRHRHQTNTPPPQNQFFPSSYTAAPSPPPTSLTAIPAIIPRRHRHPHLSLIVISASLLSAAALLSLFLFLIYCRHRKAIALYSTFPPNPALLEPSKSVSTNTSSDILYLETLAGAEHRSASFSSNVGAIGIGVTSYRYRELGSPELKPLPPLLRRDRDFSQNNQNGQQLSRTNRDKVDEENEEEEFFTPRGSSGRKERLSTTKSGPEHLDSCSPRNSTSLSSESPLEAKCFSNEKDCMSVKWPPPPLPASPPPPTQFGEMSVGSSKFQDQALKSNLKPLHWDKVQASSDRAMAWDQIKSDRFQLNEEMIETLFIASGSNRVQTLPRDTHVLDPRKSQKVAILLKALDVTIDEVCEALLEGNLDILGPELLESLLKMAPTAEEELKLKDFKDDSSSNLGRAEKFVKGVLDIPFAFKRVDAMLYIVNFDSELGDLTTSFETLRAGCEELRNSRIFFKLLEAVLRAGNRMNVGTTRGDAHAFKLDTLLNLVHVRGTDSQTSLLHFVVQEVIESEGSSYLSGANGNKIERSAFHNDVECSKLGLQVVSGLSRELSNVKKAAAMDSDALSIEVVKLATGITKVKEVVKLNEEIEFDIQSSKFSESMNAFLSKAEEEILEIQFQESLALSMVKEITEYFQGNSADEGRPFWIFMVVKDFLSILDNVCKEIGKEHERTLYSIVRPEPVNPTVFIGLNKGKQHSGSSNDSLS